MIEVLRRHVELARAEGVPADLERRHSRAQIVEAHREIGVLHLPRKRLLETDFHARSSVDLKLRGGKEGRQEKWEPLDVVPVDATQEKVCLEAGAFGSQTGAERPSPGAAIENCNALT